MKLRHTMVRKLFASQHLPREQAVECLKALAELDGSDMIQRTEWYCKAAVPEISAKRETFERLFCSINGGAPKLGLQECQEMCLGYHQYGQREILAHFAGDFFARIETFVDKAAWSQARYVYHLC